MQEHRIEDVAADIIEINVDPLGTMLLEAPCFDVLGLVVDRGVEAELVDDVLALLGAAGDADRVATLDLGDLAGNQPTAPAAPETTTVSPAFG